MPSKKSIGNNKYRIDKVIATGSFGKVYDCYPYAIKEIKFPDSKDTHPNIYNHFKETLDNQINILREVNHENMVKLYEVIYQNNCVYLVMEHCQSDLKMQTINKAQGQSKAIKIMSQILKACKQMVKLNIVHRDIKPANILYNKGVYKVADFGMAKYLQECGQDSMLKSHVGTPYYMAPQILQRKSYSKKCDIWSIGVICYQLVFGKLPWEGKDEKALMINVLSQKLKFPTSISAELKAALTKMLCISQHKRFTWQEVFTTFQLLELKHNNKIAVHPQCVTFHRSAVEKMIKIEQERISIFEFKCRYDKLSIEKKLNVRKILATLFSEEYLFIIGEFDEKE